MGMVEAATFGAGCWAQRFRGLAGMACSTSGEYNCTVHMAPFLRLSGTGEDIIRSALAHELGNAIAEHDDVHGALERTLLEQFWSR